MKKSPATSDSTVTSISPDDRAYHEFVLKQLESAQTIAQSWSNFLSGKYSLVQGDTIDNAGNIIRVKP